MPSNEGRGYVLRRIIRRAVRHGYQLGCEDIFFYKLVAQLVAEMGDAYPELKEQQSMIEKVLKVEEEQFANTLDRGMSILNQALASLEGKQVPGDLAFKLYDTYGFPVDLTNDVAREQGLTVDQAGFEAAMQKQKEMAQSASKFGADYSTVLKVDHETEFKGYDSLTGTGKILQLVKGKEAVDSASDGEVLVFVDATPFYAESGGQIGDSGSLTTANASALVSDTQKMGKAFAHQVSLTGTLSIGDVVTLTVDDARRQAIKLNHSATHLLHAALRNILGTHVTQKGSLVDADKLRFDFSHFEGISSEQLTEIENAVNKEIRSNHALTTTMMELEQAKAAGAMALFGEKYDDDVRVVKMGEFSTELCGGTHVDRTGDIGLFKITSEAGISSGVRRIEAVTGQAALDYQQSESKTLMNLAQLLKSDKSSLLSKLEQTLSVSKQYEKELAQLKQQLAGQKSKDLLSNVLTVNGVKLLVSKLEGVEAKSLRGMLDDLKNQLQSGVIVLGLASDNKANLIVGVTKDLTSQVKAGDLVNYLAAQVGGKGGGRPDMAQAGGTQAENLDAALASAEPWLAEKLN
jgi:alanyl-tRNA synthetase